MICLPDSSSRPLQSIFHTLTRGVFIFKKSQSFYFLISNMSAAPYCIQEENLNSWSWHPRLSYCPLLPASLFIPVPRPSTPHHQLFIMIGSSRRCPFKVFVLLFSASYISPATWRYTWLTQPSFWLRAIFLGSSCAPSSSLRSVTPLWADPVVTCHTPFQLPVTCISVP